MNDRGIKPIYFKMMTHGTTAIQDNHSSHIKTCYSGTYDFKASASVMIQIPEDQTTD